MYVLGVSGSPRIGGNTDILLDKALEAAKAKGARTEKIVLNNLKMSPCQECEKVRDDGTCIVEDDFQALYGKIKKADALILASPIFFGSLSAQTKIMIDRFQCYWRYKYILKKPVPAKKKPGALILVEASNREDFFNNAKSIVKNFFATAGVDYKKELFCPGIDTKAAITGHPDFLQKAFELGGAL
ncbi:MAG: flavodoxin family protein [Candidatus Omnitrophota bacterium]|nr:MAG: flavodoxin family protein [Candidatus Omnitrophota bacterium]